MGLHNELPVYKASYDLLLEIFQFTKDFSKDFKYTVGESLKNETIKLLTLIFMKRFIKHLSYMSIPFS